MSNQKFEVILVVDRVMQPSELRLRLPVALSLYSYDTPSATKEKLETFHITHSREECWFSVVTV